MTRMTQPLLRPAQGAEAKEQFAWIASLKWARHQGYAQAIKLYVPAQTFKESTVQVMEITL